MIVEKCRLLHCHISSYHLELKGLTEIIKTAKLFYRKSDLNLRKVTGFRNTVCDCFRTLGCKHVSALYRFVVRNS
jgi:hypothetical protein